jgi:hypothetical protein
VKQSAAADSAHANDEGGHSDLSQEASSTWSRLVGNIFGADPLLCSCSSRMRIDLFIIEPPVADRILRHLQLDWQM